MPSGLQQSFLRGGGGGGGGEGEGGREEGRIISKGVDYNMGFVIGD